MPFVSVPGSRRWRRRGRPAPEAIAGPEPHRENWMAPNMSEIVGLEMDAVNATHPVKHRLLSEGAWLKE